MSSLKFVPLIAIGLIASAHLADAAFGLCYATRDCSGNSVQVGTAGVVPDNCQSFFASYHTNLHEDAKCLVAGFGVDAGHCGNIPDREGRRFPILCVSQLP